MKRFIKGEERSQSALFPERLDDYIVEDNPVRIVDVFVEELHLADLGFVGTEPEATGRPSYHPSTLLKLYIYGYLNRLQSSRRLERETQRNVELMWLLGRLCPDFKTIADFRRDNGPAIQKVCGHFVKLCREAKLFTEAVAAVDGSKFKAVNNSDRAFTARKLQVRQEQLEENVARYLAELDRADREPTRITEDRVAHIQKRMETIKTRMRELDGIRVQLEAAPDGQVALTDPDARCMASRGRDTPMVGYNVQTAVDAQHHLIVAHEVTNVGNDRTQLAPMAQKAREAMGCDPEAAFTALADRGYFNGDQILECAEAGITALVPKSLTSNNRAKGLFDKQDFRYQAESDTFLCPSNQQAIRRFETVENGRKIIKYWSSSCPRCPIKSRCTTSDYRRIARWEHEHVLDTMQQRLDDTPDAMRVRRRTVEHPYATLKSWMGATHFLTKTLPKVSTEMSLHVLAYNIKRVMQILGMQKTMQIIRA
ncbi:IS1182 family transposase [Solimonas flava]|uniref:IS1182 family transposase n=1 Tax=Solimonas flava TaxID=415849 RepID=UPI000420F913|nr:IS1182 family transposase [Solimonas flava]